MATKGYDFRIEKKDTGFVFRLYPNNNKSQPIGESADIFPNETVCRRALMLFRQIISEHSSDELLKIDKMSDTLYCPYLKEDAVLFKRTIAYWNLDACKNWAKEIWDNIDAPLA
jgi:hypothetical protein